MRAALLQIGNRVVPGFDDWGLGTVPPAVGQTLSNLYGGSGTQAQQDAEDTITSTLSQNGVSSGDIQTAISAYNQIGPGAATALSDLSHGNTLGAIQAIIPLIGAGLIASGVGAPAAAVVVGGLELATGVLEALGLFQTPQTVSCAWALPMPAFGKTQDYLCFTGTSATTVRPYGPSAPDGTPNPDWLTMEQFQTGQPPTGQQPASISWQLVNSSSNPQPDPTLLNGTAWTTWAGVTWSWWPTLALDLYTMGVSYPGSAVDVPPGSELASTQFSSRINQSAIAYNGISGPGGVNMTPYAAPSGPAGVIAAVAITTNIQGFLSAYEQALIRSCEFPINNFASIDPIALLTAAQMAWNATHNASVTYTFGATGAAGSTLVDSICAGAATGQQWTQSGNNVSGTPITEVGITINVGPEMTVEPGTGIIATGGNTGAAPAASTGTKIAVGAVVVGAVAAGGIYAYADLEGLTMLQVLKRLF